MNQQAENRELVLDLYTKVDAQDFDRARELLSAACKVYVGCNVLDRDGWAGMGQMFMRAFPDGRHVFDFVEAVGDYVLLNGYFTGTHTAEFQGIPATGKRVKFSLTMIDKVEHGKMAAHRADFDAAALIQQLTQ
ncbi:MAG TPA: ester cyclase [Polyangiales bacterium]|nr:ester cyclase [Polyangiales bacterium]